MQKNIAITEDLLQKQASYVASLISNETTAADRSCAEVVIPISHFAEKLNVSQNQAEEILFNAILKGYILGKIDSLSSTVHCSYGRSLDCSGRVLKETREALLYQKENVLMRLLNETTE